MSTARPVDIIPRAPEDALPWEKLSVALVDILGGMQQLVTVDELKRAAHRHPLYPLFRARRAPGRKQQVDLHRPSRATGWRRRMAEAPGRRISF